MVPYSLAFAILASGNMPPELPSEILAYYRRAREGGRLRSGVFRLEFLRTQEVMERWLPKPPAVILDIGGGPGAYAAWLAERGYEVHLVDPVPELIEQARQLDETRARRLASYRVGDARALDRQDRSADVVLLMGPLYHLPQAEERRRALREAYRVLVPGGLAFAAAISRFASALEGLARDYFADPDFSKIVQRDLAEGTHENATGKLEYFTTAYFHRPEELEAEVRQAGFAMRELIGLEGPGWLFESFDALSRPRRRDFDSLATAIERSVRGAIYNAWGKKPLVHVLVVGG